MRSPTQRFTGVRRSPSASSTSFAPGATWSAADDQRNRLCPVVPRTGLIDDQLRSFGIGFAAESVRRESSELAAWSATARLDPGRAIPERIDEPAIQEAMTHMIAHVDAAIANLEARSARRDRGR